MPQPVQAASMAEHAFGVQGLGFPLILTLPPPPSPVRVFLGRLLVDISGIFPQTSLPTEWTPQ